MNKLTDLTFDELVRECQGRIILSIPVGKFNEQVWSAMELALRWKHERDCEERENKK